METPSSPTIEPSEPEKEMRLVESFIEALPNPEIPKIISIDSIHDFLASANLDVDGQGFIVDDDSGEYVEPYAFDRKAFREANGPSDNPFDAYFRPQEEAQPLVEEKNKKLHLSDLHTLHEFDGEVHPVRDDFMSLVKFSGTIGITFSTVTEWSDAIELIEDEDVMTIQWKKDSDKEISLNCFGYGCGYSGPPQEWNENEDGELMCPKCSTQWDTNGIQNCKDCGEYFQFEEVIHEDMYGGSACPDCNGEVDYTKSMDRYSFTQEDIQ